MDRVTELMQHARTEGFNVFPNGKGGLTLRGPRDHLLSGIIVANKTEILEWFDGLDARLRVGQGKLRRTDDAIWAVWGEQDTTELCAAFSTNLDTWDILDSFVTPRHCPVGPDGCDRDGPVLCRSCGR